MNIKAYENQVTQTTTLLKILHARNTTINKLLIKY
jgi:hypothetical protein